MKRCFKCEETLPLSDFYKHGQMADGHLGKCKDCAKADVRANRRDKAEYYKRYDRDRYHDDVGQRKTKLLAKVETHEKRQERLRRYAARYPEKKAARQAVNNALRDGRLKSRPCEVCGEYKVEAHHEDYTKPLEVRWLCTKHHGMTRRLDADRRVELKE